MSTRSAAAAASSSSKRKRRSASAAATAESPAKRRTTRGGASAAEATPVADPPTLVPVAPPAAGDWFKAMRPAREDGKFIDITLLAGERKIPTHKLVLVSHSPYLDGLLTSGLAESKQGGDTLKIGDDSTDGRAVEAIVDCFYSGQLSLSRSTVSSVIRTANLLGVDAVEKAACDFFVESIDTSTACEALAFAAAHSECGEHARELHERCVGYVVEHFAECSAEPSFLELSCEAVAEVIGNDDLALGGHPVGAMAGNLGGAAQSTMHDFVQRRPLSQTQAAVATQAAMVACRPAAAVEEEQVLSAVRAWFDHDAAGRAESLKVLLPLVRWPLLPVDIQLQLSKEPLLVRMLRLDDEARALGMELLLEISAQFAASDAAAECPRLKRRKGTLLPVLQLAFTALSQQHYATSEDGALLTATAYPGDRPALCSERVMNSGRSCAELNVVRQESDMTIGVGRPTLDPNAAEAYESADFWGVYCYSGRLFHNGIAPDWQGMQPYRTGDVLRLLLDSDAGTLTVKKNGTLLGVAVTSGLTGDLCWAVCCSTANNSVRIKAVDPVEF